MKIRIEWHYHTPKGLNTVFESDEMTAGEAVVLAEDLTHTGRAKKLVFTDQFDSTWTLKELRGYVKGIATDPHNIMLSFDGGYDRDTGEAGLGCVIQYEQNGKFYRLRANRALTQLGSNNEAEYAALHFALEQAQEIGVHDIPLTILGDSRVVIQQMSGEWPVMEPDLAKWADRIDARMESLGLHPEYHLVPRKENMEADRLATQSLNGVEVAAIAELD